MTILSRYISTAKAADILGVSITQVKMLVDDHKLKAWKTQGGHRRIALDSIESYIASFELGTKNCAPANAEKFAQDQRAPTPQVIVPARPQIAVSVQTPGLLQALQGSIDHVVCSPALCLPRLHDSPAQAMRELDPGRPNILVLEMTGSVAEQQEVLRPLGELDTSGPPISVLVISHHTAMSLPALAGGRCLVHVINAPVSFEWVCGCLAGMLILMSSL